MAIATGRGERGVPARKRSSSPLWGGAPLALLLLLLLPPARRLGLNTGAWVP